MHIIHVCDTKGYISPHCDTLLICLCLSPFGRFLGLVRASTYLRATKLNDQRFHKKVDEREQRRPHTLKHNIERQIKRTLFNRIPLQTLNENNFDMANHNCSVSVHLWNLHPKTFLFRVCFVPIHSRTNAAQISTSYKRC